MHARTHARTHMHQRAYVQHRGKGVSVKWPSDLSCNREKPAQLLGLCLGRVGSGRVESSRVESSRVAQGALGQRVAISDKPVQVQLHGLINRPRRWEKVAARLTGPPS
ncbi:unnamed protein product [Protopolystoma xenopodis]|uniref:Uncharacterized protein n=1 Tax=Protopolystoma xenopodis TaxID=117903 RepID=A0A448WR84_9PLAT|nr:unnamed protein product [Protopolystoma xenopodis]